MSSVNTGFNCTHGLEGAGAGGIIEEMESRILLISLCYPKGSQLDWPGLGLNCLPYHVPTLNTPTVLYTPCS